MTIPMGKIKPLRELLSCLQKMGKLQIDEEAGYPFRGTSSGLLNLQRRF